MHEKIDFGWGTYVSDTANKHKSSGLKNSKL